MSTLEIIFIFGVLFAIGLTVAIFKFKHTIKKVEKIDELLKKHNREKLEI